MQDVFTQTIFCKIRFLSSTSQVQTNFVTQEKYLKEGYILLRTFHLRSLTLHNFIIIHTKMSIIVFTLVISSLAATNSRKSRKYDVKLNQ